MSEDFEMHPDDHDVVSEVVTDMAQLGRFDNFYQMERDEQKKTLNDLAEMITQSFQDGIDREVRFIAKKAGDMEHLEVIVVREHSLQ